MDIRNWNVLVIEPNKFEAQIVCDLLRFSGVQNVRITRDSADALTLLKHFSANVILMELDSSPIDGLAWTRRLRRDVKSRGRKAPVFLMTRTMSRAVAEACRLAGANALIGKPLSGAVLLNTIKKVLANPRAFIEHDNYVGPCRRAGIVTAGAPLRRRTGDAEFGETATLPELVSGIRRCIEDLATGKTTRTAACEAGLREVQSRAIAAEDSALTRACAAFSTQLNVKIDAQSLPALGACIDALTKLVALESLPAADREAIADQLSQTVSVQSRVAA